MLTVEAAEYIVFRRPFDIVANEKIEPAIAVVIDPQRRSAEAFALAQSASVGYIYKCSLSGIAEETVLPDAGDQNVGKSVVVVVSDCYAHAIEFNIQSSARGHVCERAVAVVVIKTQRGMPLFVAGPVPAVDEQDVLPAVAVVVKKSTTGAQSFGQKLAAIRSAVMLKLNAGLLGDIHEREPRVGGLRDRRQDLQQRPFRQRRETHHCSQERPSIHGTFTNPVRMA